MHSLIKIMGSIYTSFLFIITIILIIINIFMTYIKVYDITYKSINLNSTYEYAFNGKSYDDSFKEDMINYLKEYRDYIFMTKAYPNIDYSKYDLDEKKGIDTIRNKINIKYENVIIIRNIYRSLTNNSVYLLINIFLIICFFLISIRYLDFINGVYFFSLNVVIGSLIFLVASCISLSKIYDVLIISKIINQEYISTLFKTNILYMLVGVFVSISTFTYKIKRL